MTTISFFLFLILLSFTYSTAAILGNETDRLALLAFKSEVTQDPLNILTSWNASNHFCKWEGVSCSGRHQRVTVLSLKSKGLIGSISPHIGNLSFLKILLLDNNSFTGEIPREFGQLFRLEHLNLNNNSLTGEIPVSISLCYNLKRLRFSKNNLVGRIPTEFGSFPNLVELVLQANELTGAIPMSLGNLTSLEALSLQGNGFTGNIPSTLGLLRRLRVLTLGPNQLSGEIPLSLYNLSSLQVLSAPVNHLTGNLHSEIGFMLPNLTHLFIGDNNFSGPLPISLFNASKLEEIDIANNQFTGTVPFSVGNLRNLEVLVLQGNNLGSGKAGDLDFIAPLTNCTFLYMLALNYNKFGGVLPSSVGNFSGNLSYLYFASNQLSGNIPTELENLKNLTFLSLDKNSFNGSIPPGIQNLQELRTLSISWNQLSGKIPLFIRNMPNLFDLRLNNNKFEGNITSILGSEFLTTLDLSFNSFTGTIPGSELALSSRLLEIDLSNNSLTSSIPFEVGNLQSLINFRVSENKMSGQIPNSIGRCSSLQSLYLAGNSFEGSLPSSLSSLADLRTLDISRNKLSGNISKALQKMEFLRSFNISFNDFEGEVPQEGIFRNVSAFSVTGNQKICGGVAKLGLPKCRVQKSKRNERHIWLKVVLGVLIPTICILALCILVYFRRKPKVTPPSEECLVDLERVSYHDLHHATDGFSSDYLIGMGSYGSVYKGILHKDQDPIAIKVLNLMEPGASKTFIAECDTLRTVRHRNLLKILTVCSSVDFKQNDFKALVFEFMPNGSLESWLHPSSEGLHLARSLNLNEMLNIAIDIASALDYLHNYSDIPIAHCDLKPSNVLLNNVLTAHVGDFGLAKFLSKISNSAISSITLRGTIGYIPPEYGKGAEVSTQGDVYSYGILLLEMFTGKRPTDHMFKDGLNIHEFSKIALSHDVMEIVDPHMFTEEDHDNASPSPSKEQMKNCLTSIVRVGVACSTDKPAERMNMKDVLSEMYSIKKLLLAVA